MLTEEQINAIGVLQDRWGHESVVLVGAAGLGLFLDMRWRRTDDLDLTVACDVEGVLGLGTQLPGWRRGGHGEHSLLAPASVRIDLIPASDSMLADGHVQWPSGFRMNLAGMRLAFDHAVAVELGAARSMRVAPPEVIAVLKVIAYLDRPSARERDLIDLAYILEDRVAADDEERYASAVLDVDLDYDEAGPYVVGCRIGVMLNSAEFGCTSQFLESALDPRDSGAIRQRLLMSGPMSWRDGDDEGVRRRLAAFARGISDRFVAG